MALSNLANSYSSMWQGVVADRQGYAKALGLDGLIGLLPIALIPFLTPAARGRRKSEGADSERPA
jgi:hypothetical protein